MQDKKEISAGGIVYLPVCRQVKIQNSKFKIQNYSELWLVTKHSKFGHWSFPKGLVGDMDKDESMEDAALREVEEEGGVKAKIVKKLTEPVRYKYRYKDTLIDKTVYYYLMKYISGDPYDHDLEVEEAKFVSGEEVGMLLTYDNDKEAFERARELLNM